MKKTNKILSILLVLIMIFASVPMTAFAESFPEVEIDTNYSVQASKGNDVIVTFTPTESGEYYLVSDNSKDYDVDPYVWVYDSDDNLVTQGDDEGEAFNFDCVLDAVADETYYIHLGVSSGEGEYDYVIKKYFKITHQPTVDEPYVELNWDVDADYQWYSVSSEYGEVTDENAVGRYANNVGPATYDEENGWTGATDDDFSAVFFEIEMITGQEIEFIPDGDMWGICVSSCGGAIRTLDVNAAGESLYYTAETDNTYRVFTEGNVNAHIRAYTDNIIYTAVDGATDAEFVATESGKYRCFVTFEDGTVLKSNTFDADLRVIEEIELDTVYTAEIPAEDYVVVAYTPTETGNYVISSDNGGDDENVDPSVEIYCEDDLIAYNDDGDHGYNFSCIFEAEAGKTYYIYLYDYSSLEVEYDYILEKYIEITHQPVMDEPKVELSWNAKATYQWYYAVSEYGEVTDKNAEARYAFGNEQASYNSTNGWSGAAYGDEYDEANYFAIEMLAGQEIELVTDADVELLGIWSDNGNSEDFQNVISGESVYFTADTTDTYYVYTMGNSDAHIRAYTDVTEYKIIHGSTSSELNTIESGRYRCKITLENGDILWSDSFIKCEHSCHQGGFTGLFWRIALFFLNLFGINSYCECGIPHY